MPNNTGLMEFVERSIPVSQILSNNNNSIMAFFQNVAPQIGARHSVKPDVLQTYIRSCAGYCVLTYLLGVGDRHLDNIMIQPRYVLRICTSLLDLQTHSSAHDNFLIFVSVVISFTLVRSSRRPSSNCSCCTVSKSNPKSLPSPDFGFIFGRDPKPLPPAFRLTKEVCVAHRLRKTSACTLFSLQLLCNILCPFSL